MSFTKPNAVTTVALVCMGLAMIFQIVGLVTPGWVTRKDDDEVDYRYGLWKSCTKDICGKHTCVSGQYFSPQSRVSVSVEIWVTR